MKLFSVAILIVGLFALHGIDFFNENSSQGVPEQIAQMYFNNFRQFQKEVNDLAALDTNSDKNITIQKYRDQIKATRYAFKKIEYFFDYRQTSYNYLNINGGPLPKLDEETSGREVIPPNGLQTLDEIIFSAEAVEELKYINQLAADLENAVDFIAKSHFQITIEDHQVIEALRSGIIRVFTLGLTGFDTPGSGNSIAESIVSMEAMEQTFLLFENNVEQEALPTFQETRRLYQKGIQFLKVK